MSGIYIPGMKMPTSCPCELLGIGYDLYCSFAAGIPARVKEYYECCQNGMRPSWCPLIELQPHGDLIDRNHLEVVSYHNTEGLEDTFDNGVKWMLEYIDMLTPVIPEDEEETP